ncbi:MAG: NAD(P)H-binding protein, partial [Parvularcula sp.]|nr:NAD(P)H-binding protein [Parvularcula sp.]
MTEDSPHPAAKPRRVFLLGATGTIGRATAKALVEAGHHVTACIRPHHGETEEKRRELSETLPGIVFRLAEVTDRHSLAGQGFQGEDFDVLMSCLASRTGTPRDSAEVDLEAHRHALALAKEAGAEHFILLSAICVQKPKLA